MPADFYLGNPIFHAKMGLFLLLGVISAWLTMRFMRWRKRMNTGIQPSPAELHATRKLIVVELLVAALIPLLAVLMARVGDDEQHATARPRHRRRKQARPSELPRRRSACSSKRGTRPPASTR